jgi:hypothetical protein
MWFRKLEYPKHQTYAIPYITECFYAGSAILIALLVALNSKHTSLSCKLVVSSTAAYANLISMQSLWSETML